MRILIEPTSHHLQNVGDVAMLQVALERLHALWPSATFDVFTTAPERLPAIWPDARPTPPQGRWQWLGPLLPSLDRRLPTPLRTAVRRGERLARDHAPGPYMAAVYARETLRHRDRRAIDQLIEVVTAADLFVVSGAGVLTDSFAHHGIAILDVAAQVAQRGRPTAMLGQGIGPITHAGLRQRCAEVLPRVDLITLRERRLGPRLLRQWRVDPARVAFTGDEALDLVTRLPRRDKAPLLGVNLRRADYAGVDDQLIAALREALTGFLRARAAEAMPIPITVAPGESDVPTIRALIGDCAEPTDTAHTPEQVARRIGGCRVMFTGSYHAAVFALGQGTPVVAFAASPYYRQKFDGLADLFGAGCRTVDAGSRSLVEDLSTALAAAWESADALAEPLRRAAEEQVELARQAYERLKTIVGASS